MSVFPFFWVALLICAHDNEAKCSYLLNEFNGDNPKTVDDAEFIEVISIPSEQTDSCGFDSTIRVVILKGVNRKRDAEVDFYAMLDEKAVDSGHEGIYVIGSDSLEALQFHSRFVL